MLSSLIFAVVTSAFVAAHPMDAELRPRQGGPMAAVYSSCKNAKDVALTFDDGPWIYLQVVSDTLVAAGAVGTFFFSADDCIYNADEQERVKYAYNAGHMIGSHTWAHLDLTTLSWDDIHDQMWRVEQALERIIGVSPAFMRPPYGNYNDLVRQASYIRNQSLVIWDFEDGDSTGSSFAKSEADYNKTLAKHPASLLTLNHETYSAYRVLPYAISQLKAGGYNMVSVATCLGLEPYHSVGEPGTPDVCLRSTAESCSMLTLFISSGYLGLLKVKGLDGFTSAILCSSIIY
ncbi:carbohydrate esterase family 4 protein [Mycena sanguinolenta]|nr:carbohydrate esterase family 4 protein [Mycena sanguinolenta]